MSQQAAIESYSAQTLFAAHAFEAAVHDSGPWHMHWGPVVVPAGKTLTDGGVRFVATFPNACWLRPPDEGVLLMLRGQVMGIRRIDHPGDTEFRVTWDFAAERVSV